MTDTVSSEQRSWIMSRVRDKNTSVELKVRSLAHRLGYRFRLHRKDLPGKPDIVFPSRRKVIFVNGCFWHGHICTRGNRVPKTNDKYWRKKILGNKERDKINQERLHALNWDVLLIWECQMRDEQNISDKLLHFLNGSSASSHLN